MSRSSKLSLAFSILFSLPFCAVGLITGVQVLREAVAGKWGEAGFLSIFAIVFGGVGFGMLAAVVFGARRAEEQVHLRATHPGEPWRWRPDWAAGRIECSVRTRLIFAWAFAILWNLISTPGLVVASGELASGDREILFVLLFPLVGMGLLVWAIRETIRHRKFGISILELAHVPGVIGRGIGGLIHASIPLAPPEGFKVKLTCVRRIRTGSGKNSSTSERVLWQEEKGVASEPAHARGGTTLPVVFRLPADVLASNDENPRDRIVWRLEAQAEVPGVDYYVSFEVPVFRTEESNEPLPVPEGSGRAEPYQPVNSRIRVTEAGRATEIAFPPARNPGVALGLTVFTVSWLGATWMWGVFEAPAIFPIVFGGVGALMIYASVGLWLGTTRVLIRDGRVLVSTGLLVPTRTRELRSDAVADVTTKIGMQAGNKPYYDITIVGENGKKTKVGGAIRSKREAEWLAGVMRKAIGV